MKFTSVAYNFTVINDRSPNKKDLNDNEELRK